MEKAYIILAHKNPKQIVRLISSLDDNHSHFFVHLDKKTDASSFENISDYSNKVVMVKKVATLWGSFGLVQATLNAMRSIMNHHKQFDFVSLISGQHYPIKSNEYINDYLRSSLHRTFIEYTGIPDYDRWKPRGGMYRIDRYFFGMHAYERMLAKAFNFVSVKTGVGKRIFPQNMKPYAGSQWWTMDRYSIKYILDFVKKNQHYVAFHKHTFAPDELFFHNIILNADDEKIRSGITNNNLLYMSWPDLRKGHPEILKASDLKNIVHSDALFARKFDAEDDTEVLNLIDEYRESNKLIAKSSA